MTNKEQNMLREMKALGALPLETQVSHLARKFGTAVKVFVDIEKTYYLRWADEPLDKLILDGVRGGYIFPLRTILPRTPR